MGFFFLMFSLSHIFHRVTLVASCIMDLKHFPLDAQECSLTFGSCKCCESAV